MGGIGEHSYFVIILTIIPRSSFKDLTLMAEMQDFLRRDKYGTKKIRKEVEHVLVEISVPAFFWSGKYGLLGEIRPTAAYNTLSGLNYRKPDDKESDLTHPRIKKSNSKYRKGKRTATWSGHRTSWYTRKGGCRAVCYTIREALPVAYYD